MAMTFESRIARTAALLLLAVPILGAAFFLHRTLGADACLPLYKERIIDPAGLVFYIEETDCDTIAKEIYAEISVSKLDEEKRTLLFRYDPELRFRPTIKVLNKKLIVISVERVSSVFYQASRWHGMAILRTFAMGPFDRGATRHFAAVSSGSV
ncbi:MAG: hypothetical protein KGL29_04505 [Alphaproteobacteria bacterium]|nr:hypothetical protein [Alphaproteobacteria bacterium]